MVLRRFLAILSATLPRPVSRTASLGKQAIVLRMDDRPPRSGDGFVGLFLGPAVDRALRNTGAVDDCANRAHRLIV